MSLTAFSAFVESFQTHAHHLQAIFERPSEALKPSNQNNQVSLRERGKKARACVFSTWAVEERAIIFSPAEPKQPRRPLNASFVPPTHKEDLRRQIKN
jgi:hypothetical protein